MGAKKGTRSSPQSALARQSFLIKICSVPSCGSSEMATSPLAQIQKALLSEVMPARRSPAPREDIVYDDDYPARRGGGDYDGDWWRGRAEGEKLVQRELDRRRREGESLRTEVPNHSRNLSTTFWGQAWNRNLMAYSDYESRLPRGRSYFRAGKVLDLEIVRGRITAMVAGTRLYEISISIAPLARDAWHLLKARCMGKIGGLMELLSGSLSDEVMREVTDPKHGLFPAPRDMKLSCTCPDYAGLCKHLAATLYATGSRFDSQPALLFTLRGVDPGEMTATRSAAEAVSQLTAPAVAGEAARTVALAGLDLADVFGIASLSTAEDAAPVAAPGKKGAGGARGQTSGKKSPATGGNSEKQKKRRA
jgi:uncharacterized Zn finger protein